MAEDDASASASANASANESPNSETLSRPTSRRLAKQSAKTKKAIRSSFATSPYLKAPYRAPKIRQPTSAEYNKVYDAVVLLGTMSTNDKLDSTQRSSEYQVADNMPKFDTETFDTYSFLVSSAIRTKQARGLLKEQHAFESWQLRKAEEDAKLARWEKKIRAKHIKEAEKQLEEKRRLREAEQAQAAAEEAAHKEFRAKERADWLATAKARKEEFLASWYARKEAMDNAPVAESPGQRPITPVEYDSLCRGFVKPVDVGPYGVNSASPHILPPPGLRLPMARRETCQRPRQDVMAVSSVAKKGPGGWDKAPDKSPIWLDVKYKGGKKGTPHTAYGMRNKSFLFPKDAARAAARAGAAKGPQLGRVLTRRGMVPATEQIHAAAPSSLAAPAAVMPVHLTRRVLSNEEAFPLHGGTVTDPKPSPRVTHSGEVKHEVGPSVG